MTENGLVAQNTWTAVRAPPEAMHTRKAWDKLEVLGILAVGTQLDYGLTTETIKATRCRIEEHTFMSTDHKAGRCLGNSAEQRNKNTYEQHKHQKLENGHHIGRREMRN